MSSIFKSVRGSVGGIGGIRHAGKDKIKAQFEITIHKMYNVPELNGKHVSLGWKRGAPKNSGTTKDVVVTNGAANWNESISVKGTLFKSETYTDKFDEKDIIFSLKQDSKVIARLTIDLSRYARNENKYEEDIPFAKKPNAPTLKLTIYTRWVKINGKVLVKTEDAISPRDKVNIDGHAYDLKTDTDVLTDSSTIDTGTGSWDDDEDVRDDPFTSTALYEAETRRTHDELESLRKQLRLVEGESSQRAKTIELQEREIHDLRRQLETLEKKCADGEELVQRAQNVENFMQQQMAIADQAHKDEIQTIKSSHLYELGLLRKELEAVRARAHLSAALNGDPSHPEENHIPIVTVLPPRDDEADKNREREIEEKQARIRELEESKIRIRELEESKKNRSRELDEAKTKIRQLETEKSDLQQRVDSLMVELEHSSFSLIGMTNKLAEKGHRVDVLVAQISKLQSQLDQLNSTLSNSESLSHISSDLYQSPISSPRKPQYLYDSYPTSNRPKIPVFEDPLLEKYYLCLGFFGYLFLLSLYSIL